MPANPLEWRHEQAGRCERFAELDALIARSKGVWARSRPAYRARRKEYLARTRKWAGRRIYRKRDTEAKLQSGGNDPLARPADNQAA